MIDFFQSVNNDFCKAKSQNQSAATRDEKLKDLAAAFDSFVTLKSNFDEGTKVYSITASYWYKIPSFNSIDYQLSSVD